jgi:hypothetical protein
LETIVKTWNVLVGDCATVEKHAEWVEVEAGCLCGYGHEEHTGNTTFLWSMSPGHWTSVALAETEAEVRQKQLENQRQEAAQRVLDLEAEVAASRNATAYWRGKCEEARELAERLQAIAAWDGKWHKGLPWEE